MKCASLSIFAVLTLALPCFAQKEAAPSTAESQIGEGFILMAPLGSNIAYLVNAKKEIVHRWDCGNRPGNSTYLLPNGNLLRTGKTENSSFQTRGGAGGNIRLFDWDGNLLWDYNVSDDKLMQHHDVEPLPNGNVLVIAWEARSKEEAIAAGRKPETLSQDKLWPETILELKPKGKDDAEVVWQWRLWDHLIQDFDDTKENFGDPGKHPEKVDLNAGIRRGGADWIHMNAIAYNPELNQIAMSARWFNEVWIIDHSTNTDEAATGKGGKSGKGGDLLFRWGNPESYRAGSADDRRFFAQHDVRWIPKGYPGAGNLTVFNNGDRDADREFSTVDELIPPIDKKGNYDLGKAPKKFEWSYQNDDFYSERISGGQRMPGGNTLICSGSQGWVFEVTPDGQKVWEMKVSQLEPGAASADGKSKAPKGPKGPPKGKSGKGSKGKGGPGMGGGGIFRAPYYPASYPAFKERGL